MHFWQGFALKGTPSQPVIIQVMSRLLAPRLPSRLSVLNYSHLPKTYADLPGAKADNYWVQTRTNEVNRVITIEEFVSHGRQTDTQTVATSTWSSTCAPGAVVTGRWSEIISDCNLFFAACDVSRGSCPQRAESEGDVILGFHSEVLRPAIAAVKVNPFIGWTAYADSFPVANTDSRGKPDFM